jgi:DNA topoisomerase-3
MTKTLIIAEKPSVANDIAKTLGGFTKHDEYFESDKYVLSSAVGHLVEIAVPEEYDVKRGKWSFAHLPMIPPHFALNPIAKTESRLKVLSKLLKRKDVSALINACDAGREGELIFRLIVQYAKAKQPIRRLWLQSMTPNAIREAFSHLREDQEMLPLADAARSRSEADWLIGINGTRAMTAFNSKEGGFYLTTVGRVQTPTLSIVVEREEKIRGFVPRDYWEVRAEFICAGGVYEGRWLDTKHRKDETDPEKRGLAQALYERHKVLTYPRTDSRHLPEDYMATVKETLGVISESNNYNAFARQILKSGWVKPNKRIFDNTKISDHFAIIPTTQAPKNLSEPEQKLYDLVTRRFMAIFFPAAEFQVTTRFTEVTGHQFKTEGKVMTNAGWLAVYGKELTEDKDGEGSGTLVPVAKGEKVQTEKITANQLVTKPPARYSDATLLSAMEGAGKLIDDEELRDAMAGKGLGTPATRAAIIEGLLYEKYLLREGRELMPTAKAFQLMILLRGLGVQELTAPELTGEWEHKLAQIERGGFTREVFMREIAQMTQIIVKRAKEYNNDTIPGDYATLKTPCPNCGSVVKENYRRFACSKCEFSMSKIPGSRQFEVSEVEELLTNRTIGPLQGFRSKMGRPFAAILRIVRDEDINNFKLEFDFGQNNDDDENAEAPDFTGQTVLGPCPKCESGVYEMGLSYVCERSVARPKACDFRSGRIILQQEILPEQMVKLLTEGKTDLMPGFVSQRTRRPFKAYLVKGKDGKVSFEFEARKPKAGAAEDAASGASAVTEAGSARATGARGRKAQQADDTVEPAEVLNAAKSAPRKTVAAKSVAGKVAAKKSAVKKPSAKKTVAKSAVKTAAKTPAKKSAARKAA